MKLNESGKATNGAKALLRKPPKFFYPVVGGAAVAVACFAVGGVDVVAHAETTASEEFFSANMQSALEEKITESISNYITENNITNLFTTEDIKNITEIVEGDITYNYVLGELNEGLGKEITNLVANYFTTHANEIFNPTEFRVALSELTTRISESEANYAEMLEDAKVFKKDMNTSLKLLTNAIKDGNDTQDEARELLTKDFNEYCENTDIKIEVLDTTLLTHLDNYEAFKTSYKAFKETMNRELESLESAYKTADAELKASLLGKLEELKTSSGSDNASLSLHLAGTDENVSNLKATYENYVIATDSAIETLQSDLNALATRVLTGENGLAQTNTNLANVATGVITNTTAISNLDTKYADKTTLNKQLIDAANTKLESLEADTEQAQSDIEAIYNQLGNCQIEYNKADGHFYITYKDGADSVSKKLDFVQ